VLHEHRNKFQNLWVNQWENWQNLEKIGKTLKNWQNVFEKIGKIFIFLTQKVSESNHVLQEPKIINIMTFEIITCR